MTTHVKPVPRERDDVVLAWLEYRRAGYSWGSIARAYGTGQAAVAKACRSVRNDDAATGEDIAGFYP